MKNLIAISAAAMTAASASAGIVQYFGTNATDSGWSGQTVYASWFNANDTMQFANQTAINQVDYAATPGMGVHSWANWTADSDNGTLTLIGAYGDVARYVTATPGGSSINIDFTTNTGNANTGIFGAGIEYTVTGTVSGMMTIEFSNGLTSAITMPTNAGGFIGVWINNPVGGQNYKIASINFSTTGTGTLSIGNINVGLVPAPGAIALVGVAGLVGSRRRRA